MNDTDLSIKDKYHLKKDKQLSRTSDGVNIELFTPLFALHFYSG